MAIKSGYAAGKTGRDKLKPMKPKKGKAKNAEARLVVDEQVFTDVIRSLATSKPMPLAKMHEKRKNPETDTRYLPVFQFPEKPEKKRKS